MSIEVVVNGSSQGESFCIAPDANQVFPFHIQLRTTDDSTVQATVVVASVGPGVELAAESVTVDAAGAVIEGHALGPSLTRGDIVLSVLVDGAAQASVQLTALRDLQVRFQGRFQTRFATDGDVYNHPNGTNIGWTWTLEEEPDFVPQDSLADSPTKFVGRVVRFHDPVALRPRVPQIGVFVHSVGGKLADGSEAEFVTGDAVIGQPVRLGAGSYFASNRRAPAGTTPAENFQAGFEPIANFEFHIGDWFAGTSNSVADRPKAEGLDFLTPQEINDYGIAQVPLNLDPNAPQYLTQLRPFLLQLDAARRTPLVQDYLALDPADRTGTVEGRNLAKRIAHLGGDAAANIQPQGISTLSQGFWGKEEFLGKVNAGLQVESNRSPLMAYLASFTGFQFFARFFNFHADELCGRVEGFLAPDGSGIQPVMRTVGRALSRTLDGGDEPVP